MPAAHTKVFFINIITSGLSISIGRRWIAEETEIPLPFSGCSRCFCCSQSAKVTGTYGCDFMPAVWHQKTHYWLRWPHHTVGSNSEIGHFQKYYHILCLSSKILHKHCFYFLLGLKIVSRENKNNAYAKCWRQTKSIMIFLKVAY